MLLLGLTDLADLPLLCPIVVQSRIMIHLEPMPVA